ncbi:anhydro-N-acetylmuramic acid kinase [Haloflavibacter putidus]|uniref:Anhydro-N-acetylmuramic acid kinase n=1 Tax=Haloflavibacter putidus TaxID=2576776 RepID=A0A507ZKV1_9FLAO|nr:anhydro-N-acetylmuramic acid kinase [Haloflavibacter putidus]TQD34342.1 anhydro-N-acetylmuramic acid kinase [Haloflavibacter putidus]
MKKQSYTVVGVMSGTSLDGIDLAWVKFELQNNQWKIQLLAAQTLAYTETWQKRLQNAVSLSGFQIEELDKDYTLYLTDIISTFLKENKIENLDAVCSHGHTVLHQPQKKLTKQIGNLPKLAQLIQEPVVCDFRTQDVALGGQGAPLVPIGDALLFTEYDFCLNLGGFANLSTVKNRKRIAYDITAVNTVLNFLAKQLGEKFDCDGKLAASGKINQELLKKLDAVAFYQQKPPKSLGIEWVEATILPLLKASNATTANKMATYNAHISTQIATNLSTSQKTTCLVTGGGAFNKHLIKSIAAKTKTRLVLPASQIIDFKEAIIFGLLGVLKLRDEINVFQSVTGASKDHVAGKVYSYRKSS